MLDMLALMRRSVVSFPSTHNVSANPGDAGAQVVAILIKLNNIPGFSPVVSSSLLRVSDKLLTLKSESVRTSKAS